MHKRLSLYHPDSQFEPDNVFHVIQHMKDHRLYP